MFYIYLQYNYINVTILQVYLHWYVAYFTKMYDNLWWNVLKRVMLLREGYVIKSIR